MKYASSPTSLTSDLLSISEPQTQQTLAGLIGSVSSISSAVNFNDLVLKLPGACFDHPPVLLSTSADSLKSCLH